MGILKELAKIHGIAVVAKLLIHVGDRLILGLGRCPAVEIAASVLSAKACATATSVW
jgi:hypothetical protein